MKISNIGGTANFGKVYAVVSDKKRAEKFKNIISESEGEAFIINATKVYKKANTNGQCANAAKKGKEVNLVITGKEDNEKIYFMEHGWTSVSGISQHISEFIELHNVKADAKKIQKSMLK